MTSFVYDFKDIAARMKGELKAQPEHEVTILCAACDGAGRFLISQWLHVPIYEQCRDCNGVGRITV